MSGIVNSGQYCYFSWLIQCFSNNPNIRAKAQEHADAVFRDSSRYLVYVRSFHF